CVELHVELFGQRLVLLNLPNPQPTIVIPNEKRRRIVRQKNVIRPVGNLILRLEFLVDAHRLRSDKTLHLLYSRKFLFIITAMNFISNDELTVVLPRVKVVIKLSFADFHRIVAIDSSERAGDRIFPDALRFTVKDRGRFQLRTEMLERVRAPLLE